MKFTPPPTPAVRQTQVSNISFTAYGYSKFIQKKYVANGFMVYRFYRFANSQSTPKSHRHKERVYCAPIDNALKMKLNPDK